MAKRLNPIRNAVVEVQRGGVDGSWYPATVMSSISKGSRAFVEYHTVFLDDESSKPLKETVPASILRPLPPPDDADRTFEPGDEVDALYNGRWVEGAVSRVLGSSEFLVTLSKRQEERQFGRSELRLHLEWIGGRWISAEDQRILEKEFGSGTPVEICSDEEGFKGAWFTAKIVEAAGKNRFLVEYLNLMENENQPLREIVYAHHIRPVPPKVRDGISFRFLEEVDAWYNDGWWVGVICKVVDDSSYLVYFRDTAEEIKFKHSELRPHQEWINRNWARAFQVVDN